MHGRPKASETRINVESVQHISLLVERKTTVHHTHLCAWPRKEAPECTSDINRNYSGYSAISLSTHTLVSFLFVFAFFLDECDRF